MESVQIPVTDWYRLTLQAGVDLFQGLREFFQKEDLKEAYIVSCIGSLDRVVLAYPKTKKIPPDIEHIILEGVFEINGISGNVKWEGEEIKVHLHGSLSRAGREVFGGAINEGTRTFMIAELVIAVIRS